MATSLPGGQYLALSLKTVSRARSQLNEKGILMFSSACQIVRATDSGCPPWKLESDELHFTQPASREEEEFPMNSYRVSFYKDLLNSDGHSFKCPQRQIDVQSDDPSQARVLAERLIGNKRLNIDCVEVMHLGRHPESTSRVERVIT